MILNRLGCITAAQISHFFGMLFLENIQYRFIGRRFLSLADSKAYKILLCLPTDSLEARHNFQNQDQSDAARAWTHQQVRRRSELQRRQQCTIVTEKASLTVYSQGLSFFFWVSFVHSLSLRRSTQQ
jgi:hypothetical protein